MWRAIPALLIGLLLVFVTAFPGLAQGVSVPGGDAGAAAQQPTPQQTDSEQRPSDLAEMLADDEDLGFSYEIYQVRAGDTVENIAARFGVSPDLVRQFNELSSGELAIGQSLAIPIPVTPRRAVERRPSAPLNIIEPRYATVTGPSQIISEPLDVGPTDALYEPQAGTRVIVNAEQGDFWGVVMIDGSVGWITKASVQLTDQMLSAEQVETMLKGGRPDIVQEAYRYLGTPYCYGGHLPYNVDCSLLVQTAFAARGIRLPRTAAAQFEVGRSVGLSELLPGDRLYFVSRSGRINHTGLYTGNGRFIHASGRLGCVAVDSLYSRAYWTRFCGARRS
jgi:cell wall-associated NlpC family hydrolase